ncbi:hypothetical protein EDC17_101074 [Sphingobacterium alimentarium]|uniref:Uncharacterized protein n=2 Tax=Sphingobacterium alimentarium TaxID=797292 RepID=A0A4R3VY75_9SPHI|nr:hypothetical protein EDC17_101074 [Sphingobacterium alimentarium]
MNNYSRSKLNLIAFVITVNIKIMIKNSKTDPNKKIEKDPYENEDFQKNKEENTHVESDSSKRPEEDTSPLPPNPNKVDDHDS